MTNEQVREQIAVLLESLIGKTWVELLENAPEVMFAQHDIDIHADQILSLLQPLIDQAKAEGRREVIENITSHGYLVYDLEMAEDRGVDLGDMIIPYLAWQALKGFPEDISGGSL